LATGTALISTTAATFSQYLRAVGIPTPQADAIRSTLSERVYERPLAFGHSTYTWLFYIIISELGYANSLPSSPSEDRIAAQHFSVRKCKFVTTQFGYRFI
jgi:hypothetical protein